VLVFEDENESTIIEGGAGIGMNIYK